MKKYLAIILALLLCSCIGYVKQEDLSDAVQKEIMKKALTPDELMAMAARGKGSGFKAYDDIVTFAVGDLLVVQDISDTTHVLGGPDGTTKYGTITELLTLIDTYYDSWAELPPLTTGYVLQGASNVAAPTQTLLLQAIDIFELPVASLNDSTGATYELQLYEMKNTMLSSYGITENSVWSMTTDPTGEAGINFILMPAHADDSDTMTLTPYTGEAFYLNGVQMAVDEDIVNADPDIGEYLVCFSIKVGASSYDISCYSAFSDWAQETPPE